MVKTTFDAHDIAALAALGTTRWFPKNTLLIQENDKNNQVFVILTGKLKVFLADRTGKEFVFYTLGQGELFGEMALDGEPRSASVMTIEASQIAVLQQDAFIQFISAQPKVAFKLILSLIGRARSLTRVAGNLGLLDVYGRVARLLLENATNEGGELIVAERMTQQEMANRVGCSREMVSRVLSDLREGGYIATKRAVWWLGEPATRW